ncbi:hypothetical protein [Micromonospora trifolii]|uniref:hypothetical protein n=1 Tax=Micromonospora trifolii TaxID=2911208 RepID=UPI0027DEC2AB|nr:hypothetical protein [Micromonospora trifolii]
MRSTQPLSPRRWLHAIHGQTTRHHRSNESTRQSNEYRVCAHLLPFFGARQLASIEPGHVREWPSSGAVG